MSAAEIIADALSAEIVGHTGDANGGRITQQAADHFGGKATTALEANGYAVVQLPEEHFAGDYAVVHIEGDEIHIDVCWIDSADDARKVAAALLRAADQLEKQLAEEHGSGGGEPDWGARADDARDAQVDRENGVTP